MAKELRKAMIDKDVTPQELAHMTGLSRTNLSRILNGHQKPRLDTAHLIADALGVHINRLFPNLYGYADTKKRMRKR